MTYDEIVDNALARALDFGNEFPTTRRVLYRRIEVRQQQIFTAANRVNPDYFGVEAKATLDSNGEANITDLETATDLDPASAITRIEIEDPGTHPTLQMGDEVKVVSPNDIDAELAPRMTLRNFLLKPVGSDLDGVVSICVHYGYRPQNLTQPLDGTADVELPGPFQELLIIDLARYMIKQTLSMDNATKAAAVEILQAEEQEIMEPFMAEVADYAGLQSSRFGDVKGTQRI